MSSKYRRKQIRRSKQSAKKEFKDEWDAMLALVDHGVEVEYGGEIYIPHDHLPKEALEAIDFLVSLDYVPLPSIYRPLGLVSSDYLKEGYDKSDIPEGDV